MASAHRSPPMPHVQLAPDGLLGKGLHGINCTILGKHLTIHVRHIFGIGRHELGVGCHDVGFSGLRHGKVCLLFGRGLPTVVGEASFDLCGDRHELGVDNLDMVVGGLHQG